MSEYCEEQEVQVFDKYLDKKKKNQKQNHFLGRTLQLVFSVSVFSLVLCYSSGLSFFPHSFNVYFSTFLFSFFTHTLERKYMFLICNGILAFLAKNLTPPGSTSSSASSSYYVAPDHDQLGSASDELPQINDQICVENVESTSSSASVYPAAADHEIDNDVHLENAESLAKVSLQAGEEEEEEEERELAAEEAKQEKPKDQVEDRGDEESVIAQEEDDYTGEADEAIAVAVNEPSTDELNKKIEEFIRKMKEDIRIEAQQQLVAAV